MTSVDGNVVRVCVIEAKGSTPREVGAAMVVGKDNLTGTIGGGALEHNAMTVARKMIDNPLWHRTTQAYPLGPSLGQCCGGFTRLLFEVLTTSAHAELGGLSNGLVLHPLKSGIAVTVIQDRHDRHDDWPLALTRAVQDLMSGAKTSEPMLIADTWYVEPVAPVHRMLFLYGAGHVGRAVVQAMAGLPFQIMWVDTGAERFPDIVPQHVTPVPATNPASIARHAPADAYHVVMTYSHALDLAICQAVLEQGQFQYLGVIGSKTKHERFIRRLSEVGISDNMAARMVCPIGLSSLDGKEPAIIAISVAADLLQRLSYGQYLSDTVQAGSIIAS